MHVRYYDLTFLSQSSWARFMGTILRNGWRKSITEWSQSTLTMKLIMIYIHTHTHVGFNNSIATVRVIDTTVYATRCSNWKDCNTNSPDRLPKKTEEFPSIRLRSTLTWGRGGVWIWSTNQSKFTLPLGDFIYMYIYFQEPTEGHGGESEVRNRK